MFANILKAATARTTTTAYLRRCFAQDQGFMDNFARQQQPLEKPVRPRRQAKKTKQHQEQSGEDTLEQAYQSEFGMNKGDLLQLWLKKDAAGIAAECRNLNLPVSEKQNDNVTALFNYLQTFEQNNAQPAQNEDPFQATFGKSKQEQMDEWLDMSNEQLIAQCEQHNLPVGDKHIANIQTLFNFIKSMEGSPKKPRQVHVEREDSDLLSGSFKRVTKKQQDKQWAKAEEAAKSQLKQDLDRIFQKQPKSKKRETKVIEPAFGPARQLQSRVFNATKGLKDKTLAFDAQPNQPQSLMALQQPSYHSLLAVHHKRQIENIFALGGDELDTLFEKVKRGPLEGFYRQTATQKRSTLINLATIDAVEQDLQARHQSHFELLNKSERQEYISSLKQPSIKNIAILLERAPETLDHKLVLETVRKKAQSANGSDLAKLLYLARDLDIYPDLAREAHKHRYEIPEAPICTLGEHLYLYNDGKKCIPLLYKIAGHDSISSLTNQQVLKYLELVLSVKDPQLKTEVFQQYADFDHVRFSLDELVQLFTILKESGQSIDSKILANNTLQVNVKQIRSVTTVEQFKKSVQLFTIINEVCPLSFLIAGNDLRQFTVSSQELAREQKLPLEELVKLSTCFNQNFSQPIYLFPQIMEHPDSISSVAPHLLSDLVTKILARSEQNKITFEHLQHSMSVVHRLFKPFTGETFQLLASILTQGVQGRIANKIMANTQVSKRLFNNSEDAEKVIVPLMQNQLELAMGQEKLTYSEVGDLLGAVKNCQELVSGQEDLAEQIIRTTIRRISKEMQTFHSQAQPDSTLRDLLRVNKNCLLAIDGNERLVSLYKEQLAFNTIVKSLLNRHFLGDPAPVVLARSIQDAINQTNWPKLERLSGLILHHLVHDRSADLDKLAQQYLLRMSNSRSLHGDDLRNLFVLIEQLEKSGIDVSVFDHLLMNVASNLMTCGTNFIYSEGDDAPTEQRNLTLIDADKQSKLQILHRYLSIYGRNPDLFRRDQYSLSPLSGLMAELFDTFGHKQVLDCLRMLGDNIDCYSEQFILKLYENYSQQQYMANMHDSNPKFFFEFSKHWPQFLKNNAILAQLTRVRGEAVLVGDQSETLKILTKKNVLHPSLLHIHFDTFIRLKDKDAVRQYLTQFISSCAYFGYSDNINIEQLSQVLRRIYKQPAEVPMTQLLDYLVLLAVSNSYYGDFDEKTRVFIDGALDLVESSFTGTEFIETEQSTGPGESTPFRLQFFKQITTTNKHYNKQMIQLDPKKMQRNLTEDIDVPTSDSEEEISDSDKEEKKSYERKASDSAYQEDFEYLALRNKKLRDLDRRGRHMLLYSNINQLNYTDINHEDASKAWAVLFHFRAKSLQSMLYEEFSSITQRNAVGKTKSHAQFNKLYLGLMEQCYNSGFTINMATSCDRTGWPIDIALRSTNKQSLAVQFLLQEELCYNAKSGREEPLGLQRLMLRHLQNISDYRVQWVTESESVQDLQSTMERLQDQMHD